MSDEIVLTDEERKGVKALQYLAVTNGKPAIPDDDALVLWHSLDPSIQRVTTRTARMMQAIEMPERVLGGSDEPATPSE